MKMPSLLIFALFFAVSVDAHDGNTLKDAYQDKFLIGVAVNPSQFCESNKVEANLVKTQFNSITPENVMKWEMIHPELNRYDFKLADRYVEFGLTNQMFIIGHTLVWHSQTPQWVFQDEKGHPATREALLQRMRNHIFTVVGHYKGRVKGWDVVNEALEADGSLRNSPWRQIIGDDFIQKAFEYAHEADPQAELYYNDYGLEDASKRAGAIALVKKLRAAGIRIDAVGIQEHVNLTWPASTDLEAALTDFGKLGIKTMVTELDVDVLPAHDWSTSAEVTLRLAADPTKNPYTNGLPAEIQKELADRYAQLFAIYLKHRDTLKRVTLWGVCDGDSWLNDWPIPGRTAYPLLFDRLGNPKPGYDAVIGLANNPHP